jgi:peptidylprolyl isomerase
MPHANTIQSGDFVRAHYTTRSIEGSVVESSARREPVEFHAGGSDVIAGLSRGVIGLALGERRRLTVHCDAAFQRMSHDLAQWVPDVLLPEGSEVGEQLALTDDNGVFDAWLTRRRQGESLLDANHPLAGESLLIDVEIIAVERR